MDNVCRTFDAIEHLSTVRGTEALKKALDDAQVHKKDTLQKLRQSKAFRDALASESKAIATGQEENEGEKREGEGEGDSHLHSRRTVDNKTTAMSSATAMAIETRERVLKRHLKDVQSCDERVARLKEIQTELGEQYRIYGDNLMHAATTQVACTVDDVERTRGIPSSVLKSAERVDDDGKKSWTFRLNHWMDVMRNAQDPVLREEMARKRATMASDMSASAPDVSASANSKQAQTQTHARDNGPVVRRILALRHEQARLQGFDNYAEMSISRNKMAGSAARALDFLEKLRERTAPVAQKEYEELLEFVGGDEKELTSPHVLFHAERLFKANEENKESDGSAQNADTGTINVETFLHGMFRLANRLFGVSHREIDAASDEEWGLGRWHPDVRVYRLTDDASGKTMGFIYFDLYAREDKSPVVPVWVAKIQARSRLFPTQAQEPEHQPGVRLPMINVCANSSASAPEFPVSSISDVFHEFGHALHYVLSEAEDGSCGYENIEWDAVEIPSYFMEKWGSDEDTLRDLYGIRPDGSGLGVGKEFRKASNTMRQIQFGLADLALHSAPPPSSDDEMYALLADVARSTTHASAPGHVLLPEDLRYPCFFTHIITGDYAEGYYGYLWSEGMASEAFDAVKADARKGMDFRRKFIAPGSSTDPYRSFCEFLGREPLLV